MGTAEVVPLTVEDARQIFDTAANSTCPDLDRRAVAAGRFLSSGLDRAKPLWEILVVPMLEDGTAAIAGKVHHALVDGIAAVELGSLLFDLDRDAEAPAGDTPRWAPRSIPSPARLAVDAATDVALQQFSAAGRLAGLALRPERGLRLADSMRRAAFAMAREIAEPAPPSFLNGPIGPERTLRTATLGLDRVLALKQRFGAKLNEVVLALVTGALRRLIGSREQPPGPLRAMVPINTRGADEDDRANGNRIAFGFVELPLGADDPRTRLRSIRRQSAALRGPNRAGGRDALLRSLGLLPGPVQGVAARIASSSRTFNLTVSNVPGPRTPLYGAGWRVCSIHPVIPLTGSHALAVGVLTYAGGLHVALHAEPDRLPEVAELPALIEDALAELEQAVSGGPGGARRLA